MGYSRKNTPPPPRFPDRWQTGNLTGGGGGGDSSGNPGGGGEYEPKNSSSGVTFNFDLYPSRLKLKVIPEEGIFGSYILTT